MNQDSAAEIYERLSVPAEFAFWAGQLLDATGVGAGARVLDVACGTGIVARQAVDRVGPAGAVAAIDADPSMLAVARRHPSPITWAAARAEALPYRDARFDVVLCQFGLMFFSDRPRALAEWQRVLVAGGRVGAAVWGSLAETPAYAVLVDLVAHAAGRTVADVLAVPFALGGRAALGGLRTLFEDAGWTDLAVVTRSNTSAFAGVRSFVDAELRGWMPSMGARLTEAQLAQVTRDTERELHHLVDGEGALRFPSPAHLVTARH